MKTIAYFTSDTCKPCKTLLPKVLDLVAEKGDIKLMIIPIDTRDGAAKAMQADVMSVPTLLFPQYEGDLINDMTPRLIPSKATIKNIKEMLDNE